MSYIGLKVCGFYYRDIVWITRAPRIWPESIIDLGYLIIEFVHRVYKVIYLINLPQMFIGIFDNLQQKLNISTYLYQNERMGKKILNVNTVKSRVEARVTIQKIKSLGVLQTETCH